MVVTDWGSADVEGGNFFGGTPIYAGPQTFEAFINDVNPLKDIFSFGRIAIELMMDKSGIDSNFLINPYL